jgi:hypothetical protein
MHQRMNETPVRIVHPLRNDMRRIQMIVPKQKKREHHLATGSRQANLFGGVPQFGFRERARPPVGPESGRFRGIEKRLQGRSHHAQSVGGRKDLPKGIRVC